MTAPEVTFSELSQHPNEVANQALRSASRSVRIRRRAAGDEDLVLTTASRVDQEREVASATAQLFVALMQHNKQTRNVLVDVAPSAFPWVRFLPAEDVRAFVGELVEVLRAAESLHNPAPVAQLITEWRHTAEIHADAELRDALTTDGDDFGPVAEPLVS